jgi:hypothetical protein
MMMFPLFPGQIGTPAVPKTEILDHLKEKSVDL